MEEILFLNIFYFQTVQNLGCYPEIPSAHCPQVEIEYAFSGLYDTNFYKDFLCVYVLRGDWESKSSSLFLQRRARIQAIIMIKFTLYYAMMVLVCYTYEIYLYIYYSFAHSQRASINKVLIYSVKSPDHLHYTVSVQYQEYHYILILKMLFGATYAFMGIINFSHLLWFDRWIRCF